MCGRRGTSWLSGVFDEASKALLFTTRSGSSASSGYAGQMSWIIVAGGVHRESAVLRTFYTPHIPHSTHDALYSTRYTPAERASNSTVHSSFPSLHDTLRTLPFTIDFTHTHMSTHYTPSTRYTPHLHHTTPHSTVYDFTVIPSPY